VKIAQIGCSGTYNYGDEMSHRSVRMQLREIFPDSEILQFGSSMAMLEKEHSDADAVISFSNLERILHETSECDFWVYGPGTVMTSGPSISVAGQMFAVNKNLVIWGVGAGSFKGHEESTGASMIKNAILATARDVESVNRMKHVREDVYLIPDPMLIHCKKRTKGENRNGVTISSKILARGGWLTDELQDSVMEAVSTAINTIGGKWTAIPASWLGGDYDSDHLCHKILSDLCPELDILIPEDFDDVTEKLSNLDYYITSRLHTGVPAAGMGVKTVFFGDDKTRFMCEGWGEPEIFAGHYRELNSSSILSKFEHLSKLDNDEMSAPAQLASQFSSLSKIFDELKMLVGEKR
jgi:polysaccharide pyruvyl transferase WcaK-like protein